MKTFERRQEAWPWWMTGPFVLAVLWLLYVLYRDVFGNLWAMLPLIGVVGYLLAALALNRSHVRVDASGFRREYGPLRLGPPEAPVEAGQVRLVFVRTALVSMGKSSAFRLRAGIATTDGRVLDITEPGETEAAVRAAAQEIAEALGGHLPVTALADRRPHTPGSELGAVALWFLALFGSVVWAIAVQLFRFFVLR
jgi:hypothetical protein